MSLRHHSAIMASLESDRAAADVAWKRLNDRIIAGLRRSAEADARSAARIAAMENNHG